VNEHEQNLLKEIQTYNRLISKCTRDGYRYASTYAFIEAEGRFWKTGVPHKYARRQMMACYHNSACMVRRHKHLTYVEGIAIGIIPTAHAWCVDPEGNVIDSTWESSIQLAYYGIPFNTEFVLDYLKKVKYTAFIDDWNHRWPLMKIGAKGYRHGSF